MRYVLDRSVRRLRSGRLLLGGSPGRLFRLTEPGAALVDRIAAGRDAAASAGADALLSRLVDAGVLHPTPEPGTGRHDASDVTVVVPVRDRPDGLARLLRSLGADGAPGAIVVVDDGSATPVEAPGATVRRNDRPLGPAAARNAGAAGAATSLVAFVDSDCEVEPGWLAPLLGHFDDPRVAAVAPRVAAPAGPVASGAPEAGAAALVEYERARSPLDLGTEPARVEPGSRVGFVPSAALVVRRDELAAIGGFDTAMHVGEDVDLVWRLVAAGNRVRYEPRSLVRHDVRGSLGAWLRQRFAYGTSAAALDARHPGAVAPVVVSAWSAAVWTTALRGRPVLASSVAAGTVVAMARGLPDVPLTEVARLVLGGHLSAGRQVARATVREWWPAALVLCASSRRARRTVLAASAVVVADALRRRAPARALGPVRLAALALVDDAAYGAGVWAGCVAAGSFRALLPRVVDPRGGRATIGRWRNQSSSTSTGEPSSNGSRSATADPGSI